MTVAFNHIGVSNFSETVVLDLVMATTEKLPKARAFYGLLSKIILIGAVKVGVPTQILFLDLHFIRIRT